LLNTGQAARLLPERTAASHAAEKDRQKSLLKMQTILGFREDQGARPLHYRVADFKSAMLRVFLLGQLTSSQAHEYLESLRSLSEQEHAHYEQVLDAYDWSADDDAFFARAVLEQGLRWTQHEIDWANWVIDGLNRRSRKSS